MIGNPRQNVVPVIEIFSRQAVRMPALRSFHKAVSSGRRTTTRSNTMFASPVIKVPLRAGAAIYSPHVKGLRVVPIAPALFRRTGIGTCERQLRSGNVPDRPTGPT